MNDDSVLYKVPCSLRYYNDPFKNKIKFLNLKHVFYYIKINENYIFNKYKLIYSY